MSRDSSLGANHYIFVLGRIKATVVSTTHNHHPYIAKLYSADFNIIGFKHATAAALIQGTTATTPPTIGRISLCETQGWWVGGYNKATPST